MLINVVRILRNVSWKEVIMRKWYVSKYEEIKNVQEMISLREREKKQIPQQKLAFNITYYPVFQNVESIMEELIYCACYRVSKCGPLTCDSKNVLYVLKCTISVDVPCVGIQKPNSIIGLIIIKVNTEQVEGMIRKFLRNYFLLTIASIVTV